MIFCSTDGGEAISDLLGAPRGGNGEADREILAEEFLAEEFLVEDAEAPQFKQKLGLVGEDGVEIEVGDDDSGLFVREILREWYRVDCSKELEGLVKDKV